MKKSILSDTFIPNWIVWSQAICFSVLYAIWALPETILVRHICLIIGALLSLWIIYQNRHLFLQKCAIPIWLISALFAWVSFHLFFLSTDFAVQYEEYTSIWKRVALGTIFAIGFGIALSSLPREKDSTGRYLWVLMYLGLLAPTLIYIIKFILTNKAKQWGIVVPDYGVLYYGSAPYYLPKTAYVCFCLPTLGIALGQLVRNIHQHQIYKWGNVIYLVTIPAVLFVFYAENIKNGMVYSAALLLVFFGAILFRSFSRHWAAKLVVVSVVLVIGSLFVVNSIQRNESWRAFIADAKVAADTQTYPQWKYNGAQGYPNNELGSMVSVTNYERLAWGKIGLKLIAQNPLGYGLVERSFGRLAKINWPDTNLHQSHSGWIDLGLGIGVPGLLLILGSLLLLLYQLNFINRGPDIDAVGSHNLLKVAAQWALFSLLIMWCTTEISQKIFFDDLIFWIALVGGVALGLKRGGNKELRP
ncbi:O-antigen ligase family protein [Polynucleobacter sp. CS-Odin-A6]|uniref:O-antigen ligase family protein n=1 Tax=Polynucleobacter sp. CS-Odin-A6 TaxID=2689106 RepID=UPI001C0D7C63|nr:O-antigen ligase family protein [Polynucleobacter sp. CS-Odin-A6]MBU3621124.1 O-antigen ligase family protein [Polynucleobacter sp. CS-Odin-A6]